MSPYPRHSRLATWNTPVVDNFSLSLAAFYLQTLLFGLYVVLFIISAYLLYKNKGTTGKALLALVLFMFTLAAGDTALTQYYLFGQLLREHDPVLRLKHIYVKMILYITNNLFASIALVHFSFNVQATLFLRLELIATSMLYLMEASLAGSRYARHSGASINSWIRNVG
ncbi:hypothetical protein NP233_g1080 [Leucocoprinus birnbaumii]|uniref:Uncharacterized protein n=1 Tax=Leucocoprinus birnbaumii TaxID=56174 RepID=A0AAD5W0L8_9AGAR|nr:hypothetical protein NP233_g1080 [Leucocoprinus birnbaumii]